MCAGGVDWLCICVLVMVAQTDTLLIKTCSTQASPEHEHVQNYTAKKHVVLLDRTLSVTRSKACCAHMGKKKKAEQCFTTILQFSGW